MRYRCGFWLPRSFGHTVRNGSFSCYHGRANYSICGRAGCALPSWQMQDVCLELTIFRRCSPHPLHHPRPGPLREGTRGLPSNRGISPQDSLLWRRRHIIERLRPTPPHLLSTDVGAPGHCRAPARMCGHGPVLQQLFDLACRAWHLSGGPLRETRVQRERLWHQVTARASTRSEENWGDET